MEDNAKLISDRLRAAMQTDDEKDFSYTAADVENATIADLMNLDVEEEPEVKKAEEVVRKAKKVDLSSLKIVDTNELDKERAIRNALYGNKSLFMVIAAQSGYSAKLVPLVHKDSVNILYSHLSRYEYKKAVYKVIHEKIYDTGVGKMSFDEWLKSTSVEDVETFYYGLYCATFPNEGSFEITCPHCGDISDITVNHKNLFTTTDLDKMKKTMATVSAITNKDAMREYSLIGKYEAFALTESGIIAELRTPTLYDSLELLKSVPENIIDKDPIGLTNMLYINKMYAKEKNSDAYVEISNRETILKIIDSLSIDDAAELEDAVSNRVDDNRISYSIKNVKCPMCGKEISNIPISVEDMLFTLIFEKTQ